jgi:hypothetical protein
MLSVTKNPLSVANNPFMLSVIMLSVVMINVVILSVVAPPILLSFGKQGWFESRRSFNNLHSNRNANYFIISNNDHVNLSN